MDSVSPSGPIGDTARPCWGTAGTAAATAGAPAAGVVSQKNVGARGIPETVPAARSREAHGGSVARAVNGEAVEPSQFAQSPCRLIPSTERDSGSLDIWVPLPEAAGPYQMDLYVTSEGDLNVPLTS